MFKVDFQFQQVPSAAYSVGLQPQFAYQVPLSGLTSVHSAYYPFASPSIYPTNVYLTTIPGVAPIPLAPAPVAPLSPEAPSQMNSGDADTTVVESADQPKSQEASSTPTSAPSKLEQMFQPANTFPNFPSIPQIPQLQESPQDSQSNFPQFPQPSSDDDFSQGPGAAPPSFLGDNGGNKGFNDEDTVSVESA